MTQIKICGFKSYEDAVFAHNVGADALGFVIDVPINTPRKLSRQEAADIITKLPPYTVTVGVIMPNDIKEILEIIEKTGVNAIQIHGYRIYPMLQAIKRRRNIKIIRCYSIDPATKVEAAIQMIEDFLRNGADAILLDTKGEENAGGTGRTHNWNMSREIKESFNCPFIIAGGLTSDNVVEAINTIEPYAVDVASGVESTPGVKNHEKIREFIQKVRNL